MTMTTEAAPQPGRVDRARRRVQEAVGIDGRPGRSARLRILGWYVALLALSLFGALLIQRSLLLAQVIDTADAALDQEVSELRQLATGVDPTTGEPFGSNVVAIFDVFLSRNVGVEGEGVVTIVDGRPYKSDVVGSTFAQTELLATWVGVTEPVRDQRTTELGPIRYLAVPLEAADTSDGAPAAVFVVAVGLSERLENVDRVVRTGGFVFGSVFILATAVAWLAAGDVLRPLRQLRDTARSITESDLTRRIDVEGTDEIAGLSLTFNEMLDRLEESFRTQQRFLDDAGHELRTPITIIRGQLETVGNDPIERAEVTALVIDELDRMSRIVEDLLGLAKAEQPDFVVPRPVDLAEFVADIARKAESITDKRIVAEPVDPAVIDADPQRLSQAVINLVKNAAEHTPDGSTITLWAAAGPQSTRITVSDDGAGIPDDEREHIFERFGRGERGRRTTTGAGLGLAITQAVAEAHGGRVLLDSRPGRTVFTIEIPSGGSQWPAS